jgi:hypothetical protein
MKQGFDITTLVDELEPVRPLRMRRAVAIVLAVAAIAAAATVATKGARADVLALAPNPMFLLRGGLLLLLGTGCGWAALAMASPSVGKHGQSWKMALAAAALLPLAAVVIAATGRADVAIANAAFGLQCMLYSAMAGLATAIPMVLWLRHGAPTSPERAGWLTGIAAGGLGAFAYSLHCPFNDIVYIGLWYSLSVGLCAIIGRLLVPKLIRW